MAELSDDARRNRDDWTRANAEHTDARASAAWAEEEITWGVFYVPEASLGTLGDVDGLDVVELGCGTAYVSAWLARRGARPVGVDVTPAQLATARRCQEETGVVFPLAVLPDPLEALGLVNPVTWWVAGVRLAVLPGGITPALNSALFGHATRPFQKELLALSPTQPADRSTIFCHAPTPPLPQRLKYDSLSDYLVIQCTTAVIHAVASGDDTRYAGWASRRGSR